MIRPLNVYEAAMERLRVVFDYFDYVYVSFQGARTAACC